MGTPTQIDVNKFYGDNELRWYQIAASNETIMHIRNGVQRVLICKPTGTGKTITVAATLNTPELKQALKIKEDRALRVLFIAHIHRLLTQAERTFAESNNVDLKVATPFTDINAEDVEWADVIIIDEAHHEAMMSVQYQLENLADKPIIGLTATPDRPDGLIIKFEEIVNPISREQAVAEGFLAETSIWSFIDTSGRNKTKILKDVIKHYHHIMAGTMCFVSTIKEVKAVAKYAISLGIRAVALTNQSKTQLDDILDKFSQGKYDLLVNCSRIGEGVDTSGCTSVILGQNINSYTRLNQIIGRAARPDSECQVFELVNPLSGNNLDTTVVVGTPKRHVLCSTKADDGFKEREFNYVGIHTGMKSGIAGPSF